MVQLSPAKAVTQVKTSHDPRISEPALTADRVTFAYNGVAAVDGLSLALHYGETIGVIGPNGSGKSTLLRLLSGVLQPQAGVVQAGGRSLRELTPSQLGKAIAVVPQNTNIEFAFSVTEVVLMGRTPHLHGFAFESDGDLGVAQRAMQRTGTLHLANRQIQHLSGGELQRVVVARALAQQTDILLLDEPGAFLDIRHQVEIHDLLRELQAEGKAILTVLHDLNLAALYCDRVALMNNGKLVQFGTPAEVITYANLTSVYGVEVYVDSNDITGAVNVLPLSRPYRERLGKSPK